MSQKTTDLSDEKRNQFDAKLKKQPTKPEKNQRGFAMAIIGLAVLTVILIVLIVLIPPIMTPESRVTATAISITKTCAYDSGEYIDPDLLIEPLPVENVSGIAILGGLMVLIVLGMVLREVMLRRREKKK